MSSLAGFWHYTDRPEASFFCSKILDAAPLGSRLSTISLFNGTWVALGIRELSFRGSISEESTQLLVSRDGRYRLVGDIRIDNRADLANTLNLDAVEMNSISDAALVMVAWERWKHQSVLKIVGSFAFAIWDAQEREMFLARDPEGERPLYYHSGMKFFAFASTARALLQCPGIDPTVDESHLALSLCGLPNEHSRSWLAAVNCVAPGHSVVARAGSVKQSAYWHISDIPDIRFARNQDYVEAFLDVFDEAVRCRLLSDGVIAAELSAGLDSSSVCATAARLLAVEGRNLTAFTSVPSIDLTGRFAARYMPDEGPSAALLAQLYPNIDHRLIRLTSSDLLSELHRTHPSLDRPMVNSMNNVWLNLIQEQASRVGAKVLLNGQRGNITISTPGMLRDVFQQGKVFSALRLARQHKRSWAPLLRNAFKVARETLLPHSLRPHLDPRFATTTLDASPINPQLASELHILDRFRKFILAPPGDFRAEKWQDFNYFDVGDFHFAAQNMWGIDHRDPTSDRRVLAFCMGIPMEQYVVGGVNCSLLRRAMRGRLPEHTLNQPLKGLQSGDWYESLTAIVPQMIAELARIERSSLAQRILNLPRLRETLENWPANAREAVLDEPRYHSALTRGIACGYFLREFEGID